MVSNQLTKQTPIDKVKPKEKNVSLFFGSLYIFFFNKSNPLRKII